MQGLREFGGRAAEGGGQAERPLVRLLLGAGSPVRERLALAEREPPFCRSSAGSQRLREALAQLQGGAGGLNPSQLAAVQAALTRTITLWQVGTPPPQAPSLDARLFLGAWVCVALEGVVVLRGPGPCPPSFRPCTQEVELLITGGRAGQQKQLQPAVLTAAACKHCRLPLRSKHCRLQLWLHRPGSSPA